MKFDNNNYGAPMGYCDRHTTGYVKSIGCADCNAKDKEAKVVQDKNTVNNVMSVRIFPATELQALANSGAIKLVVRVDKISEPVKFGIKEYFLFVNKDNPHLLYTKINATQAMEITIELPVPTTPVT